MFIVKLILVPLWPFFITNWIKARSGEFTFKNYIASLLVLYLALGSAIAGLFNMFVGKKPSSQTTTVEQVAAPTAEVAK